MSEVVLHYGDVQIGIAPRGWGKVKIDGSLVSVLGGFSCARTQTVSSGVPHLRPMNISTTGEVILTSDTQYVRPNFRPDLANYHLQSGDILFNNTNSVELVGKTAVVREPMAVAFSNHINRLRVRDVNRIEPRWLALALRNLQEQGVFAAHCNRWIGQAGFSVTELAKVDIPIPYPDDPPRSLAEQRRIVARLETLLGEVRELRRLQAEIEADVGRLMEAVLAEVFDDQNEWPTVPLGDVFKFRSELVRPNDGTEGELTFVGLQHIASGTGIKLGEERLDAKQLDGRKFRFSPGQILYGSLRPYLNKVWIADCEGICSVDQFVLCPQTDHVDTAYLAHYLRSKSFLRSAQERSSALDLPRIRRDRLVLIEMPLPPVAEQRDIAHYLDTVTSSLAELKSYQNSYTTAIEPLEQSILAQAFRGE